MFIENTPIEEYIIDHKPIAVKREDMYGEQPPMPALAKLRGASVYVKDIINKNPGRIIGVFDTTISKAGQGIAYFCKKYGAECWHGYPVLKGTQPAESKLIAESLGAKQFRLKAGTTKPIYYMFRNQVIEAGGIMLPLGLVCHDTVEQVKKVVSNIPKDRFKTIVVSTGSATIAAGLTLGFIGKIYGISCGMSTTEQYKRMKEVAYPYFINYSNIELINTGKYGYYDKVDVSKFPFPTSPYYDGKAFEWLLENYDKIDKPVLFWNIGY